MPASGEKLAATGVSHTRLSNLLVSNLLGSPKSFCASLKAVVHANRLATSFSAQIVAAVLAGQTFGALENC